MPIDIEWLDRAKADFRAILNHIAQDKPAAARSYVDQITETVGKLGYFPESGRRFDDRYRVMIAGKHLIFYRYAPDRRRVVISAVVDGRRDLAKVLRSLR